MDELFKLLFYIIIGIVWVLSNAKKQTDWQEDKPNLTPRQPKANPLPKPKMDKFSQEGIFSEAALPAKEELDSASGQPAPSDRFKQSYYDKELEIKKQRLQEQKKTKIKQPVLQTDSNRDDYVEKKIKPSAPAIVSNRRQKQSYHLKSSSKEGIIWSIVLGAPRSKQAFNWQTRPLNR